MAHMRQPGGAPPTGLEQALDAIRNSSGASALPLLGVVGVAALIMVPVPTPVVDTLLTLNLTLAIVVLLAAITTPSTRTLSALPGLLVLTTLFRLALNVSTTRLILGQGHAGEVVAAFGEFVVAGSYLVGGVVFAILTIVQFVVIANGAGRVAEVGARFALDALPGSQAAIDADLRSGAIGRPEAERRRRELATESRLFGALDGAMRFVRGDAVAALIITGVNLLGGVAVGATTHGMAAGEALRTYGLLTIGDGIAAQLPAVLISVAAGLAVTRVDDPAAPTTLPEAAARQLGRSPTNVVGAGGLLTALGLVPGLPTAPFVLTGMGTVLIGWALSRGLEERGGPGAPLGPAPRLELLLGPDLVRCLGGRLRAAILADGAARSAADFVRWPTPMVEVRVHPELGPDAWRMDLDGVRLEGGVLDPSTPQATTQELARHVERVASGVLPDLVDVQTTADLLRALEETHPALVREATRGRLPLPDLTRLLASLMEDRLPAGDLRAVLEAVLATPAAVGPDPATLAEAVRPRFRRQLEALVLEGRADGVVEAHTLDEGLLSRFEDVVARRRIAPPPAAICRAIQDAAASTFRPHGPPHPVLFVPAGLRGSVRRALGPRWRRVAVLAGEDVGPALAVEPAGVLAAPATSAGRRP